MAIIRDVTINDAKELLNIYEYYILNTAITFEINVPTLAEFEDRIKNITEKYPYICIFDNNKILGYAYAHEYKPRDAYKYSCELSIYLDNSLKGHGFGKLLYNNIESRLKEMGIKNIYSCVTYVDKGDEYVTNNSVEFHKHLGFVEVGHFHKCGYKFDRWYDILWLEKILED